MIVKIIEAIEVVAYEPNPRGGDNMPVRKYFLRDGTPLEIVKAVEPSRPFSTTATSINPDIAYIKAF
jgi:hypothetical protein